MKTLVKSKITVTTDGHSLIIWLWKKNWWIFGHWYSFGASTHGKIIPLEELNKINDEAVSKALFENIISL